MEASDLINKFYNSFSNGDVNEMILCYHKDIVFSDPAFGKLEGERAVNMWKMLLSNKSKDTKISHSNVKSSNDKGEAKWVAEYYYGVNKRKVINHVSAQFKFKEGKIIEHIDTFDLWRWSKQALGVMGYLLGWTSILKNKIQQTTNKKLDHFIYINES